jgi:hypothetical protein
MSKCAKNYLLLPGPSIAEEVIVPLPNSARPGLCCDRIVSTKFPWIATLNKNWPRPFPNSELAKKLSPAKILKRETALDAPKPYQNDLAHFFPISISYIRPNSISLLVMSIRVLFLLMSSVAVFRGEAYPLS